LLTLPELEETADPLEKRVFENCQRMTFEWLEIWTNNPRLREYLVDQMARKKKTTKNVLKRIAELEDHINTSETFKEG